MAWSLFSAKRLSEPMLTYYQLKPKKYILVKFYKKFRSFIQENTFEDVICKLMGILARPPYVKQDLV